MRPWLVIAAALVVLAGCERAQDRTAASVVERAIERQGREARVEIDREEGSITVHLGDAIVPEGWPEEIPVPPGARRLRVVSSTGGREVVSVSAETDPDALGAWYRDALARDGWDVDPDAKSTLRASRTGRQLAAVFTRRGERTRGRIEVGPDERGG